MSPGNDGKAVQDVLGFAKEVIAQLQDISAIQRQVDANSNKINTLWILGGFGFTGCTFALWWLFEKQYTIAQAVSALSENL